MAVGSRSMTHVNSRTALAYCAASMSCWPSSAEHAFALAAAWRTPAGLGDVTRFGSAQAMVVSTTAAAKIVRDMSSPLQWCAEEKEHRPYGDAPARSSAASPNAPSIAHRGQIAVISTDRQQLGVARSYARAGGLTHPSRRGT